MSRTLTLLIAAFAVLAMAAAAVVEVLRGAPLDALITVAAIAPATGLGLRVLAHDPANRVGQRLVWLGAATAFMGLFASLEDYLLDELGRPDALLSRWVALIDDSSFLLMLVALGGLVAIFPTGEAPTPRMARLDRLVWVLVGPVFVFSFLNSPEAGIPPDIVVDPPFPQATWTVWVTWPVILLLVAYLVAVVVGTRRRYRASTGIERLQLSWLAYASASVPLVMLLCFVDGIVGNEPEGGLTLLGVVIAVTVVPTSVAVAVLRYRLYEIDRLVNRSIVYATLTVLLAAVYGAIALAVGVGLGGGTAWSTALATLAVATAFRPVRDRLQRAVDRRFARRRYLGLQRVERFLADVRAGHDEPERIGRVLAEALDDDGLEVWFRLLSSDDWADADGHLGRPPHDTIRARTPVRRGDLELGLILHDPELEQTPDTLDSIVRAAGLAMEIARLRVEVRVQLAEVQASRGRLAAAAEAERRKLERDLHDGAQQRLIALGLALRHAQHQLDGDPDGALRTIDDAVAEVATAVAELRALARGLRPELLDAGLGPALTEVAARAPLPVDLEIAPARDDADPDLETAAFYLVCEALTNVAKHASARRARVRVDRHTAGLRVEIADDGVGGAAVVAGGGLEGIEQRVRARGGQVTIASAAGRGTQIVAELPR